MQIIHQQNYFFSFIFINCLIIIKQIIIFRILFVIIIVQINEKLLYLFIIKNIRKYSL